MAILVTGNTFSNGDQVTATKLNASVNSATFHADAVDGSTTQLSSGSIIVKDGGIVPAKLSTGGPSWVSSGLASLGDLSLTNANPEILGGDTDGVMYIAPSSTKDLGGNILLYGDTHASKAKDIELRATTGVEAHYDDSASKWDFQANAISTSGVLTAVGTSLTGTAAGLTSGNVTTNANLTGHVTSVGNAAVLGSFTSLQLKTALSNETGSGAAVFATSPTLVTPALGTPASGTVTNLTGTASININGTVGASTPAAVKATTLSTTGNVGIGTASPGTIVDINDDASTGTGLRVTGGGGGQALATFTRDVGSTGSIMISSAGGDPQMRFTSASDVWSMGLDSTVFNICDGNAVGSDQRLVIDTDGNVGIGTTSPDESLDVVGAGRFSTGVTFGTDTDAANKLDDYEEGTWTPQLRFGTANVGLAYTGRLGTYTKIGDLVTVSCEILLSAKGSSTGFAQLIGLPFTSRNVSYNGNAAALVVKNISFADIPMGECLQNQTAITFYESTNAGTVTDLTDANFSDTSQMKICLSYRV